MDEIEKYETFMRGAFTMLEGIRMQVAKNKPSYADDIEEQTFHLMIISKPAEQMLMPVQK